MFAYCGNNPVIRTDPSGQCWQLLIKFIKLLELIKKLASAIQAMSDPKNGYYELVNNPSELTFTGNCETTYENETTISVIARMLYGEDHNTINEHMHILENRLNSDEYYMGNTYRELILADGQFSAMEDPRALNPKSFFGNS